MKMESSTAAVCSFHKCGSNWFRGVFWHVSEQLSYDYIPTPAGQGMITKPIQRNGNPIYIFPGGNRNTIVEKLGANALETTKFVLCVRSPKDALVSQYFSWRKSHKNNTPVILKYRERLANLSVEKGLELFLTDRQFAFGNQIQKWQDQINMSNNTHIMKYEDLHADFHACLRASLDFMSINYQGLDIDSIQHATSFETITDRKPGEENQESHRRKGIVGDHKNYFTTDLDALFEEQYGAVSKRLGY